MKVIFVLLMLPLQLFSQDLSGIWVGTIATSQVQMPFQLAINQDMSGYSMISFTFKGTEKTAVKKITLIRKDSTFTISDDKLIYDNIETKHRNIKSYCELSIKMVDTIMVLSGPFHTRTRDLRAGDEDLATGTITLQKQAPQTHTKLISKLDSLKLSNTLTFSRSAPAEAEIPVKAPTAANVQPPPAPAQTTAAAAAPAPAATVTANPPPIAAAVPTAATASRTTASPAPVVIPAKHLTAANAKQTPAPAPATHAAPSAAAEISLRKTQVIRTIDFKSDSLILVLYDNGIVDGDTVSVVLNGEVIIPKQRLSDTAYQKVIKIPPGLGDSLQLVIYAENLGSIPPNSGLLIIKDGSDRNDIGFEGDLKRSSAVILKRKH